MGVVTKFTLIAEGWKNLAFENPRVEAIAKKRATLCSQCPNVIMVSRVAWCEKCWCPIASKTRATGEQCPIGKWGVEK